MAKRERRAPFSNFPAQPKMVTAAQNAKGSVARAQIAVTQATFSNSGASWRIFLTNAISLTPEKPRLFIARSLTFARPD
jgi:hypothetical protein